MPAPNSPLATPLKELPAVGPERAAQLARLGLLTVEDLLLHRPNRYEDRRHLQTIRALQLGKAATTRGRIVAQGLKTYAKRTKSVFEFVLEDGTGRLHCRWWNLPFLEKYFAVGDDVMVFGKPNSLKPRTIDHPETENVEAGEEISIHLDRIAPVYPLTEGLPQRWLRGLIWRTLEKFEANIGEPAFGVPPLGGRCELNRQMPPKGGTSNRSVKKPQLCHHHAQIGSNLRRLTQRAERPIRRFFHI